MNSLINPSVGLPEELHPDLIRILAPNPSPMTFQGTNTYILGKKELAIIDPGPNCEAHLKAILKSIKHDQKISHIFVTHSHIDHSPLAARLANLTAAPILAFGNSLAGKSLVMNRLSELGGGEGLDDNFIPDVILKDGQTTHGKDWTIEAIHTPGHLGNHLCFNWIEKHFLFSGDLVMGWASSMVSPPDGDLTDFMSSLKKLMLRKNDLIYFPGHGDAVYNPSERLKGLYAHRKKREAEILSALELGLSSVTNITNKVYTDLNPKLIDAAKRNVLAHLIDLTSRNLCVVEGSITLKSNFVSK